MCEVEEPIVLRVGTWLYAGEVEMPVWVTRQTWDAWYEEGYDDRPPDLNDEGHAFYAIYGDVQTQSHTCFSLAEAVALAEATLPGTVEWGRLPGASSRRAT